MWLVIDAETHEVVGDAQEDEPEAEDGRYAVLVAIGYPETMAWSPELQGFVGTAQPPRATLTPLAFQRLFSQAERIAIRTAADPIVQDFMALSALALDIDLTDPDVVAGVGYLEYRELIGEGRAAVILAGQAPA